MPLAVICHEFDLPQAFATKLVFDVILSRTPDNRKKELCTIFRSPRSSQAWASSGPRKVHQDAWSKTAQISRFLSLIVWGTSLDKNKNIFISPNYLYFLKNIWQIEENIHYSHQISNSHGNRYFPRNSYFHWNPYFQRAVVCNAVQCPAVACSSVQMIIKKTIIYPYCYALSIKFNALSYLSFILIFLNKSPR